jgi:hypothetical protein
MPVILSKTVATVCLPPTSTDPDHYIEQNGAIMGWAEPNSNSILSPIQLSIDY